MLEMVELLLHWLASLVKARHGLEAENLVVRHQVNILRRSAGLVWLYRLWPSAVDAVAIVRPETLIC
jgi:hypothetical protein